MRTIERDKHISYIDIRGSSVNELVKEAIYHILNNGTEISVRAGDALQAYGVNYILTNPKDRLHSLRDGAKRYLCRELVAYFKGDLTAENGLGKASKFWMTLVDENGKINSNYGYYVFHEEVEGFKNQYEWVIKRLLDNKDSRRAIVNINQNYHKSETKDFPCTVAMQFFIKDNQLHCEVMSRSTDVITGLPYDMGFFSFIHELLFQDLREQKYVELELGYTVMKTSFTQIYEKTRGKALEVINGAKMDVDKMPEISNAKSVLNDIYNSTQYSEIIKWVNKEARFEQ